jgi:hypothetical protein
MAAASMGVARADPPPDLHALLTCEPQAGHFMMKTRESAYPFDDTSDSTADPDVTARFELGQHKPYECRLPGFVIDVRTEDYQPGRERGECAISDKGSFVIRGLGFSGYVQRFGGLGGLGLRPPIALMEGPDVAARQRGRALLRLALLNHP